VLIVEKRCEDAAESGRQRQYHHQRVSEVLIRKQTETGANNKPMLRSRKESCTFWICPTICIVFPVFDCFCSSATIIANVVRHAAALCTLA
jgi:hypothetical protein